MPQGRPRYWGERESLDRFDRLCKCETPGAPEFLGQWITCGTCKKIMSSEQLRAQLVCDECGGFGCMACQARKGLSEEERYARMQEAEL
jgi:hypothetical protein